MISKELKMYCAWLSISSIALSLLNSVYFKTIFFSLLLYKNSILEFSYENSFSLLNLEFLIFAYIFVLQFIGLSFILIGSFIISGLFYFEVKILFKLLWFNLFLLILYVILISTYVEKFFFCSNLNSSSSIILLNPNITTFIIYKWKFHIFSFLILILSYYFSSIFLLFILALCFKKELGLLFSYFFLVKLIEMYHAEFTIKTNYKR